MNCHKEKNMKKKIGKLHIHHRRGIACILFLCFLLMSVTSCGRKEAAEAPELLTPAALTDSYRPVERRDIGAVELLTGVVVPETYPVFSESPFAVYEMKVAPGDHVEKGDVIAVGDTGAVDDGISSLNTQLDMLSLERRTREAIAQKEQEKRRLQKKASEELGLSDDAAQLEKEMQIAAEDLRYALENLDASIAELKKQLTKQKEIKAKLTFTAPHSGEVTFLRDLSAGNTLGGNENVAVISDFSDLYIEVPDMTTETFKFGNYPEQYILVEGQRHKLTEYAYTSAELGLAENLGAYPTIRFRAENYVGEVGAKIPLYFVNTIRKDVLAVSNDSVYREGDFAYCYVLSADGQKERRSIEAGERDLAYTEIISGLSEGEAVYYDNKSVIPVEYKEFTVKAADFTEEYSSEHVSKLLTANDIYTSSWDGTVTEVMIKATDSVEKGQELCRIAIPVKRGELADAANRIADAKTAYEEEKKNYQAREAELRNALREADIPDEAVPAGSEDISENVTSSGTGDSTEKEIPSEPEDGNSDEIPSEPEDGTADGTPSDKEDRTAPGPSDPDEGEESDTEELRKKRDGMYRKEQINLDLEILQMEKKLSDTSYADQKKQLDREYSRLSGSGVNGEAVIKAEKDGNVGQIIPALTGTVYEGDYLLTVIREGKKLLRVSMPKARGKEPLPAAKPGQTIRFTEGEKTYTGKCVAANGYDDRIYLFTRDGKEYITRSSPYAAGSAEQFFVEVNGEFPEDPEDAVASYDGCIVHGGTPVPAKAIYTENDQMTEKTSTFVWKITDSGLVKEEVRVLANTRLGDEKLILSGLKPGDVIAVE